jgi:hypothetical protein
MFARIMSCGSALGRNGDARTRMRAHSSEMVGCIVLSCVQVGIVLSCVQVVIILSCVQVGIVLFLQ